MQKEVLLQSMWLQFYSCGGSHKKMVAKKAILTLFYGFAKASFGMLGKIFDISRSVFHRWIKEKAVKLPKPIVDNQMTCLIALFIF